jgi:hypothetical protein
MKKFYIFLKYCFLFILIFLMGCTKDIDIQEVFDFELDIRVPQEGFVFETAPFDVTIKPQKIVDGTTYKMSFVLETGESYLETASPTIVIKDDEKYIFPSSLEQSFKYIPKTVGTNKIIVTVADNHGVVKTKTITFQAKLAPFTFLLTPNLSSYTINAKGAITSTLIRKETDSFKFSYLVENGTGTFFDGTTEILVGNEHVLENGVKELHYMPTTLGIHKITATATASDGAKITRQIELVVDNVPFTLSATAATTSVNVNQDLVISIDLSELTRTSNVTYELAHSFDPKGISGTILNPAGLAVQAGVFSPIVKGTYQYKFRPTGKGVSTITFKVKDSNGQTKEATVVITVENVPFSFTATPSEKAIRLNEKTILNFNLVPNAQNSDGVSYKLVYQSVEGDGTMTDSNGTTINAGTPVVVTKGAFSFGYIPKTLGNHKLNFVVTDNKGEERTGTIEMASAHTPVTFNVSSVTQTYVNQGVPINFVITPQNAADLNYKMNYFISGGEGKLQNGTTTVEAGQFFDVSKGAFQYKFTPIVAGNFVLTFQLKDSNGQIVSKDVTIVVLNNKFSFTPTPSQNVFVNENNAFSYALVPTGDYAGTTYNVSYSIESGKTGSFFQDDKELQQGIPITVTPTAFKLIYKPTAVGIHKIHYIVTDSNGLKEEIIQEVNVIASDFKFNIQQANTKIYKNNSDALILSLSQEQINPRIKYTLKYTITGIGKILNNGTPLKNEIEISPGNHNYTFISDQSGTSKIEFIMTDTNGITHSQTINYTVINADFSLSTSGDGTINLGKSKPINFYLSQVVPDDTATYEVRYLIQSGSTGAGKISKDGNEIPFGTFQTATLGSTALTFLGTQVGIINLKVEVKDSNGVIRSSIIAFNIAEISYTFTGGAQNNSIFLNGSTPLNFDITESSVSETNYEIKYSISQGEAEIRNGASVENANVWYPVAVGGFNRTFIATAVGEVKILFTVRNKTTLIEKTQIVSVTVKASEFSFTANATSNNEITKTPVNVNFNIAQTGGGADTYQMIFSTSSTGTFTYNGITYTSGQVIPFNIGSSNGKYTGTVGGVHNITFSVSNQNNLSRVANVNLTYKNNDFTLATSGDGSLNVNTEKGFNLFLSQETPDNAISYQVKYSLASGTTGNGIITDGTNPIAFGDYQDISKGTTASVFRGTAEGIVNVLVTVKDSNGITRTSTLVFNVKGVDYSFTGASQNNSIFLNDATPLNFDITETISSGTNYEMKYAITEGAGQIKNGATVENANVWSSVSVGGFNRTFASTAIGSVKVLFTVRNKTTLVEKSLTITLNVKASEFTFTANATSNNEITKTPVNVNFNVAQTGGGTDTYKLIFSTSSTGIFTYNGVDYTAGQVIPFVVGASNGKYIGSVGGVHSIAFSASNQNNVSKTANVSLTYINNDFSLATTGDGTLNVSASKSFNVSLSQQTPDPAITYQVKYSLASGTTGNGVISDGTTDIPFEQYITISKGITSPVFKSIASGIVNVLVTVKDSNGITHTSTLSFNVKPIDYTFTGTVQNNSIYINGSTPINFEITENISSGTNYEMKFTITNGDGQVKNGATIENSNVWTPVTVGNFNKTFVGTTLGSVKILFTVRNKTTMVEKTQLIDVNVKASEFSFNANATANNQVTGTPVNINLNLIQTGGSGDVYNLQFSTSGTGTFTYNGTTYTAGQLIPFSAGASSGTYTGATAGTHNITFTITNQLNASKTANVSLKFINNDFTLSTTGDGTVFVNQLKDINAIISQLIPDPSIQYQVKFSFEYGSSTNGQVLKGGNPVALGSYSPIALGNNLFSFKGLAAGSVTLLIEVQDSNGIRHSSSVALDIKNTEFSFTGGVINPNGFVNEASSLNFELTEASSSGTGYELSYNITNGNATIKDGGTTLVPFQWNDVSVGTFTRSLIPLTGGNISVTFTVRNKVTLQTKTVNINVNSYRKPTLTNIRTGMRTGGSYNCGGGACDRDYDYLLSFTQQIDPTATLAQVKLEVKDKNHGNALRTFFLTNFVHNFDGYINMKHQGWELSEYWEFNGQSYTLTATDSNGYSIVYTGTFTNVESDFQ